MSFRARGIFILIFLQSIFATAQESPAPAYKIKAVFLYNFTQFVDWPTATFTTADAPFIIGIIGNNPFGTYIEETVMGEKVGTHPIVVRRFNSTNDISNCHMLFINYSSDARLKETIEAVSNKSILTIGEGNNFLDMGGIIRFYTEQNKIRLQINTEAARVAQLNISSKLLSVAKTK